MNLKHLLLSASFLALISADSFASRQRAAELADLESNEQAIVQKLMLSRDYTINFDVDRKAEGIKNAVIALIANDEHIEPDSQEISLIKSSAKDKMQTNLESLKNNPVHIGHGYYTGSNYNGVLSTISHRNPLAYPVFSAKGDRDQGNSFLPTTYRSNFLSRALCDEIRHYAYNNGLSESDAQKLNKYVQPIFYITQLEVMKILEGNQNLASTKKWVYGKGYDDIVKSIQDQTEHHHALIGNANIRGLDPSVVETRLVPRLIDLSFSLLSNPKKELYITNSGQKYLLGKNKNGFLSLIHPSNGLPYPIFKDQRPLGDMNLPDDYQSSSLLRTQWQRVGTYLEGTELAQPIQNRLKVLLEPVAYMAHDHFKEMRMNLSRGLIEDTLRLFIEHEFNNDPDPYVFATVIWSNPFFDQDISRSLSSWMKKVDAHNYLVEDLYPKELNEGYRTAITQGLTHYLLFNEVIDRIGDYFRDRLPPFVENLRARGNY